MTASLYLESPFLPHMLLTSLIQPLYLAQITILMV